MLNNKKKKCWMPQRICDAIQKFSFSSHWLNIPQAEICHLLKSLTCGPFRGSPAQLPVPALPTRKKELCYVSRVSPGLKRQRPEHLPKAGPPSTTLITDLGLFNRKLFEPQTKCLWTMGSSSQIY